MGNTQVWETPRFTFAQVSSTADWSRIIDLQIGLFERGRFSPWRARLKTAHLLVPRYAERIWGELLFWSGEF